MGSADLTNATWTKASYSGGTGGNCVEVANLPGAVAVRDSKNPGPALVLPPAVFEAMTAAIRSGQLDVCPVAGSSRSCGAS
jgi:Domain of unknown function (DUF397)